MSEFNQNNYTKITTIGQLRALSKDDYVYHKKDPNEKSILHSTMCGSILCHAKEMDQNTGNTEKSDKMILEDYYHIPKEKLADFTPAKKDVCLSKS